MLSSCRAAKTNNSRDALIGVFGADRDHGKRYLLLLIQLRSPSIKMDEEVRLIHANGLFTMFIFQILTSAVICNCYCSLL